MLCEVVGSKRVDFTDGSGRTMQGYTVYVTHEERGVMGLVAEKCAFLRDAVIRDDLGGWVPSKGDLANAEFNRNQRLEILGPAG